MKLLYWAICAVGSVLLAIVAALVCAAFLWVYAAAWAFAVGWDRHRARKIGGVR